MKNKNEYGDRLQHEQYAIINHRKSHANLLAEFLKEHYLNSKKYYHPPHQNIDFTKALVSKLEAFHGEIADLVKLIKDQLLLLNTSTKSATYTK